MGRSRKPAYARLEAALRGSAGVVRLAAQILCVKPAELRQWMTNDPKLQRLAEDIQEHNLDEAEHQLRQSVLAGDHKAIKFAMRFYTRFATSPKIEPLGEQELDGLKQAFEETRQTRS